MTLEQLVEGVKAMEVRPYTPEQLIGMLHESHVPRFKKLKRRLTVELLFTMMLAASVAVITGLLAGPVLAAGTVAACAGVFLFNQLLQYYFLQKPKEKNLHLLMFDFGKPLKKLLTTSRIVNVGISMAMLAILIYRTGVGVGVFQWAFLVPVAFGLMAIAPRRLLRKWIATETFLRN